MARHGDGTWRRMAYLATVIALLLSLMPVPRLAPPARANDPVTPPLPASETHESPPIPLPQLPGLALSVAVSPDTLAPGMVATLTVHVTNDGEYPGDGIVVSVAPPAGATPQPGHGFVSAQGGWRWAVGHLDANGHTSVSGTFVVSGPAPGDAILATATLTASGQPQPIGAEGGAIIDAELAIIANPGSPLPLPSVAPSPSPTATPSANPVVTATRQSTAVGALAATPIASATPTTPTPSPSTAPDQGPRTARHTPGQETTLTSADGHVEITMPADATSRPVTLRHGKLPLPGDSGPIGVSQAGRKRGFGTFFLSATDDSGAAVTQFASPVTITAHFTPEQLRARGIAVDNLAFFWYDTDANRWAPVESSFDEARGQVSAHVTHFTPWQLSDNSSPSENYLPTLKGWQTSLYTGAATYSMPIEVPAGPGGVKPNLTLSYNSQATDGPSGRRSRSRAGWAGLGWSLDTGSINLVKTYNYGQTFYSLSINGRSYQLVPGAKLAGNSGDFDPNPTHWEWHTSDESYLKVAVVQNAQPSYGDANGVPIRGAKTGSTWLPRYIWTVWTQDNTKYEFAEDLWQGFSNCDAQSKSIEFETYKWQLSKVTDRHGNVITYNYARKTNTPTTEFVCSPVSGWGAVDGDAWPDTITWGSNPSAGAGAFRFQVRFESVERSVDNQFDHPTNQYGEQSGDLGQPRATRILQRIYVCVANGNGQTSPDCNVAGSAWRIQRFYVFTIDNSLHSDCETSCDPNDTKLTLKDMHVVGQDTTTNPISYPGLPGMAFRYNAARGTGTYPNPDWNRLNSVLLNYQWYSGGGGSHGALNFTYQNISQAVAAPVQPQIFANRRRAIQKVVDNGWGQVDTWGYAYDNPELNSVGWQIGGYNQDGTTNHTQQYPNSAAIYLARVSNSNPGANDPYLLNPSSKEFRGHAHVVETDPTGAKAEHWFYQGDAGCAPSVTGNNWTYGTLGVTAATNTAYENDPCFVAIRTNEFLKGREWKTEKKAADGTLLQRVEHGFTVSFNSYSWEPENGVWWAWSYESQQVASVFEGAGPAVARTTNYDYTTSGYQDGGGQYGNLRRTAEYDGDLSANPSAPRVRLTERWYNTLDTSTSYLVNAIQQEALTGPSGGPILSLTGYFYDGSGTTSPTQYGVAATGNLTLVRSFADAAGKISGADTSFRYDAFGNQTQQITYAGYASVGAQAGNKFDGPGGGSAARTTTISYENFFNAFPTVRQRPTVNGVTLTEDAAYDFRLGVVTSVHDPAYNLTSATYDPFGRLKTLVRPFDSAGVPTVSMTYYDWDFPIRYIVSQQEVAGNGAAVRPTITFYDGVGRKLQTKRETVDGLQTAVQNWYYDGLDRVRQWTQPRYHNASVSGNSEFWGYTTTGQGDQPVANFLATFDALGRPRTTTTPQPNNKTTTTTYYQASFGTAASTVDANGHKTRRESDLFGRLRAVLEYSGSADTGADPYALYATTTYAYDPRDLLTSATDAQGNVATMTYDGLGRKTAMHDPDMGDWSYTYNPDGTLATQTDAKGQVTNFTYDALGRLTGRATPADGRSATFEYDDTTGGNPAKGKLTKERMLLNGTSVNSISFFYDVRGRVKNRYTYTAALAATRTIGYAYDSADRLTSITYPGGEVVTAGYDAGWRQTNLCSTTYGVCYANGATYNALDEPTAWTFGNGLTQTNT